jgi:hypothetical protein
LKSSVNAPASRHLQAFRNRVDRDHPLRPQQEGAADGELADGTTAPDGDGVALLDIAIFRRHVAGWKNVRQEQHLFIRQPIRHLDRPHIGVWHP